MTLTTTMPLRYPSEPAEGEPLRHRDEPVETAPGRDRVLDALRAASLTVVVLWHWVFTVLVWRPDGPHASNPIATTPGLWAATWVLQVMPVFFVVGGAVHLQAWQRAHRRGNGDLAFLGRRFQRLVLPTLALIVPVSVLGTAARVVAPGAGWVDRGLVLLVSPLWFLGVYLVLAALTPLAARAHQRRPLASLAGLALAAVAVDVARLVGEVPWIEWANFVFVYGFAHQLGFWWSAPSPRRPPLRPEAVGAVMALAGLAGLATLTHLGPYPRSMVGVPGDAFSNVAPPTVCLLALTCVQFGTLLALRRRLGRWLAQEGINGVVDWTNRHAMAVYLWHFSGYALFAGMLVLAGLEWSGDPDGGWWLQRPLWLIGPALATWPLIRLVPVPGSRPTG